MSPTVPGSRLPRTLPPFAALTPLVGREVELAEIESMMRLTRLLTITGIGGVGKTRLALQAATQIDVSGAQSAFVVELRDVEDREHAHRAVHDAIRRTRERSTSGGVGTQALEAAAEMLGDAVSLLILDACEHVLDAAAMAVPFLLRRCPRVRVLATSREPLGVEGETVWQAPPLSVPRRHGDPVAAVEGCEAGRLFLDSAARVRPGFVLTDEVAPHILTICHELDGLPLAIALAAERVRVLSPAQIATQLSVESLRLLAGGPSSAPGRRHALLDSLQWSYAQLTEEQRLVFRRLAIATDWGLDGVVAVCAADKRENATALDTLAALADRGLITVVDRGVEMRYRMLRTVRSFALGRLRDSGEEQMARRHHLHHFRALAARAEELLVSDEGRRALEAETPNLHAALDFALTDDPALALALAGDLGPWWLIQKASGYGRRACARVLDATSAEDPLGRAKVLWAAAVLAVLDQDIERAHSYSEEALSLAERSGDRRTIGRSMIMAVQARTSTDADATALAAQAVEILRSDGDEHGLALAHANLALVEGMRDRFSALRERCQELQELPGVKPHWLRPWIETALARADLAQGDPRAAIVHAERALELEGDRRSPAHHLALAQLLHAMVLTGQAHTALRQGGEVLVALRGAGLTLASMAIEQSMIHAELALGELDSAQARAERGCTSPHFYAAARAHQMLIRIALVRRLPDAMRQHSVVVRATGERAGSARLLAIADWADGAAAMVAGEPSMARTQLHASLAVQVALRLRPEAIDTLEALGELAIEMRDFERGARLLAAAQSARRSLGIVPPLPNDPRLAALRDRCEKLLGRQRLAQAWNEGDSLTLERAIDYAQRGRGRRARPAGGWESLTPVEADVAKLAATGLTNTAIGARMFISRGTVKHHLSHVYAKLDVANRTQLASLGHAHGAFDDWPAAESRPPCR